MEWIDTHAHIYELSDVEGVVERSRAAGVGRVYMPNLNEETFPRMLALEARHPVFLRSMLGLHPCEIDGGVERKLARLVAHLGRHDFAAIGEIGIDLYHDSTYLAEQVRAFRVQVGWAQTEGLPLVIHCRSAFGMLLDLLEELQDGGLRGVIHCFTGTLGEAKRCMALGFYLGIGGIVTYPRSPLAAVVSSLPLEHLVLETDSPYLSPVPKRGGKNEPSFLPYIASEVARLKGLGVEEVAEVTSSNARDLFGG